jgi:putative two-component system response regulator
MLKACSYRILEARRPSEALNLLAAENIDLIIVDLMMPEMSGPDFCRLVKANRRTRFVPIIIITSVQGVDNEVAGLESGADEFLLKPLQPTAVRTRVRAMLRSKRAVDSLEEAETILFALAQAVELRDQNTANHCQRLAALSVALGTALGLADDDLQALRRGGYMHDVGKICVPDAILFKKGKLTDAEWAVMRSHTTLGEEICRPMKSFAVVLPIIRSHHERFDGGGYPDGLAGEDIPLLARILQLADIYDALVSARTYKEPIPQPRALEMIHEEARKGWRDPELTRLFCEIIRDPALLPSIQHIFSSGVPLEDDASALEPMRASLAAMRRHLL